MRWENLKGRKFWKLVCTWNHFTKKIVWLNQNRYRRYEECICECWNVWYHMRESLLRWDIKSCWCLVKEFIKNLWKNNIKHWLKGTYFYKKYNSITQRCNNKNIKEYKNYWWRWIKCEWNSFEEFKNDMYESYLKHVKLYWEKDTTIDRINNNRNYCKENCRWATMKEQWQNRRNNLSIEYKWIKYKSLACLCDKLNLNYKIVHKRIFRWMDINKAVEQERRKYPLHIKKY